jgi:hypothetical protein
MTLVMQFSITGFVDSVYANVPLHKSLCADAELVGDSVARQKFVLHLNNTAQQNGVSRFAETLAVGMIRFCKQ